MVLERFGIPKSMQTPLFAMGGLFMSRSLDMTDPTIINYIRAAFTIGLCITGIMIYISYNSIQTNKLNTDSIQLKLKPSDLAGANPMGTSDDTQSNELSDMTASEYDMVKLNALIKQTLTTVVIMCGMHFYMGFVPPLLLQSYMLPLQTSQNEIIQLHTFHQNELTNSSLKRPFAAAPSPFAGLMGGSTTTANEAAANDDSTARVNRQTKPSTSRKRR